MQDLGRIPELKRQIQNLETNFENACSALNGDFAELIDEYRGENRRLRSSPEPKYFNQPVRLREYIPEKLDMQLEPTEQQRELMINKLSHFSNRLHEEFKVLTGRVIPSNDIILKDPLQISPRQS